jgi:hypothetical protein
MRSVIKFGLSIAGLVAACNGVNADTLEFNGTAASTCSLTNPVNGTIELQPDLMSWATATPATIVATNTSAGSFALTVTHDTDWATKPTGTPATTFTHLASIAGANASASFTTNGAATTAALAAAGVDNVSVALSASAAGPYRAGPHKAQVTVTCATP